MKAQVGTMAIAGPPPGESWTPSDTSATLLDGWKLEGLIVTYPDLDYSKNPATTRSARQKKYIVVRNRAGVALVPKQLVKFEATDHLREVDGYTNTTAELGYPVDEFLPAAGAADKDLLLVGIEGPHMCKTGISGEDSNANFTVGAPVVALSSASGDTESGAGRIGTQVFQGVTDNAGGLANAKQTQNMIGHALSAVDKTSDDTNVLVNLCIRH